MVPNIVHGMCIMDRLYQEAKKNVGGGRGNAIGLQTDTSYNYCKRKIHTEYYRLIKAAGIEIEGM